MGSQSRPERRRLREQLRSAALGGLILGVSLTGVAPTAQATSTATRSAQMQPLTAADDQVEEQAPETAALRHHRHRHHHHRHHHHRRHHRRRHHHRHHHRRHHHRRHHHRHHHHHTHRSTLMRRRALSKAIARRMIPSSVQFACFSHVISHESGWNPRARNSIGAYGLPQALPARKLATAGSDWRTNPRTQLRWAVHYMHERYGSPCKAWAFWRKHRWY